MHTPDTATDRIRVGEAITGLAHGEPVVLKAADTSNYLVLAAHAATARQLGWMVRHTSGFVLAATTVERLNTLAIPPMLARHGPTNTGFAVSVDAAAGITTGISGSDRATTLRVLASPGSYPTDLVRPGHLVPLRIADGGVLARAEAPEAAVDLLRLAHLPPVAGVCVLVGDHGQLLTPVETRQFASEHALTRVSVAEVIAHRLRSEPVTSSHLCPPMSTPHGTFAVHRYRDLGSDAEYLAFYPQPVTSPSEPAASTRPAWLDVLAGPQPRHDLDQALATLAGYTSAAVVYPCRRTTAAAAALGRIATEIMHDLDVDDVHICPSSEPAHKRDLASRGSRHSGIATV